MLSKSDLKKWEYVFNVSSILLWPKYLATIVTFAPLFINNDAKIINNSLKQLDYLNERRKIICDKIVEESKQMLLNQNNENLIVLYKDNWDIGVLGIVASRLCEEYNKPTIIFGASNGELKGSGRSIGNIDIYKLFSACKDLLNNFGGHSKAGGLSINKENLNKFKNQAKKYLIQNYTKEDYKLVKLYDLELKENDISLKFANELNLLQPFGYGNNTPVFLLKFQEANVGKLKNFANHITINLKNLNLISFNDSENFENYMNFKNKQVLIELQINEFKGKKNLKGIVKNSLFNNPSKILKPKLEACFVKQILYENSDAVKVKFFNSENQLNNIIDDETLIVTYNINTKNFSNFWKTSFIINKNYGQTTLIYGLNSYDELNRFKKIIFLEKPLNNNFLNEIKKHTKAEIYLPINNLADIVDYQLNREELLDIYFKLQKSITKNLSTQDLYSYYEILVLKFNLKTSFVKFILSLLVFEELNIVEKYEDPIKFKLNKIKTDLEKSMIYLKIKK